MKTTVAVFASGGFYVDDTTSPAVDGNGNLYLIVPSDTTVTNSDSTPLTSCPTQTGGKKSAAVPSGDIWLQGNIVNTGSNVGTFLYSPYNICTASNPSLTGQVYAGQNFYSTTGWTFTADTLSAHSPFTGRQAPKSRLSLHRYRLLGRGLRACPGPGLRPKPVQ